jgi:hypothetical protein
MGTFNGNIKAYFGLGILQALIGLGAIGGGLMLVVDPTGRTLGVPSSLLEGSIFPNFLIPGVFLMVVNGFGSGIGAALSFTKSQYTQAIAKVLGVILVLWIVIQVIIIRSIGWLHGIYFFLGIIEIWFGIYITRHIVKAS